jgi:hypothetical protein
MSDQEDPPETIPSLRDTGEAMTEEEEQRRTTSPEAGDQAGDTSPPSDAPGKDNRDVTPEVADDAEKGQTESPGG